MMSHRKRNKEGRFLCENEPPKKTMRVTELERKFILQSRINPRLKELMMINSEEHYKENKEYLNAKRRERYITDKQHRQRVIDRSRQYYNGNKQRVIDRTMQWQRDNPEKVKASDKRYREANRENILAYKKEERKKYPERIRAQNTLNRALKTGNIKKPKRCTNCGAKKSLDAHHEDYDKPLQVIWLCKSCHKILHRAIETSFG